jgi:CBS domain-containing protein/anti-sigma regulatory factor (Ser/Thr protein kinase)
MSNAEVLKAQELVYELRVDEVMTGQLITVSPDLPLREVKQLMRDNRISGLPVVEDGALAGIISLEDLIRALEESGLDRPTSWYMTKRVQTVRADELVVSAVKTFGTAGVGRLPVLSEDGRLVGIVTPGDVTRGVLRALQTADHEEEIRRYRASHLFEDLLSDDTSLILRYTIAPDDFRQAGRASSRIKQTLHRLGVDPRIIRRVAIASYEAEMNIVIHSTSGGLLSAKVTPQAVKVIARDDGPGIIDVEQALQPGFSTAPDSVREMGFGAGMGLCNIRDCSDDMHLQSSPELGTRLEAVIYLNRGGSRE